MKFLLFSVLLIGPAFVTAEEPYDLNKIRDRSTLETRIVHDWQPNAKDPRIHQKLIEITVCEWWPGQRIRLPVTLNIPAGAKSIENVIVANCPLAVKTATPRGVDLEMLKEHGVGVVLIGMGTIDAMSPAGELHLGMREHLLKTHDIRYTPAWIWGISQMRALTAAEAESEIFQPEKVLTTGGSKRGVAAAAAGIHDDRFTAILPVVAPILGNPGGSFVVGTDDPEIVAANEEFLAQVAAGKLGLDPSVKNSLDGRTQRRINSRITLKQALQAGWTREQIDSITDRAWYLCKITQHLEAVNRRGLDYFYIVGTNDSVSPALLEVGNRYPNFPHLIVPGGQHGGPAGAGFTTRTPLLKETSESYRTFCLAHFFNKRTLPTPPAISYFRDHNKVSVTATFAKGIAPQSNTLAWSVKRHRPYTLAFEYDAWQKLAMSEVAPGTFEATIEWEGGDVEFLTTHTHLSNGLPFHFSSSLLRIPATSEKPGKLE